MAMTSCAGCAKAISDRARLCPFCGHRAGTSAAEPLIVHDAGGPPLEGERAGTASRIAGAVLLLGALISAALAVTASEKGSPEALGSGLTTVIDLVLGLTLVAGSQRFRRFAFYRALVGLVVGPFLVAAKGAPAIAAQVLFAASLVVLLGGVSNRSRILAGLGGIGASALLIVTSTYVLRLPRYALRAESDPLPAELRLTSADFPYTLTAPSAEWRIRKPEAVKAAKIVVDRWLVQPRLDAHLTVAGVRANEGGEINLQRFEAAAIEARKKASSDFELLDASDLPMPTMEARLLHYRASLNGEPAEFLQALYVSGRMGYELVGWTHQRSFAGIDADLRRTFAAFTAKQTSLERAIVHFKQTLKKEPELLAFVNQLRNVPVTERPDGTRRLSDAELEAKLTLHAAMLQRSPDDVCVAMALGNPTPAERTAAMETLSDEEGLQYMDLILAAHRAEVNDARYTPIAQADLATALNGLLDAPTDDARRAARAIRTPRQASAKDACFARKYLAEQVLASTGLQRSLLLRAIFAH